MGKPSAAGQPTRPTQSFILSGSINWVVSNFIGCAVIAPSGECSRGYVRWGSSTAERRSSACSLPLNFSVYSTTLHGGCCVSRPAWWILIVLDCAVCLQSNKRRLLLLLYYRILQSHWTKHCHWWKKEIDFHWELLHWLLCWHWHRLTTGFVGGPVTSHCYMSILLHNWPTYVPITHEALLRMSWVHSRLYFCLLRLQILKIVSRLLMIIFIADKLI